MKKGALLILGLLFMLSLIKAAYIEKLPYSITQPDGKTINCFVTGDEFYNWIHDANGFTIIQAPDGYYYYAEQNGESIQPSKYLVNKVDPATVGLPKWAKISKSMYDQTRSKMLNYQPSKSGTANASTTGNLYNLVVYIRFLDDTEFTDTRQVFEDKFNPSTGVSLKSYFKEVSYDNLIISSIQSPACALTTNLSYQDSHPRGYFQPFNETTNPIGYTGGSISADRFAREDQLLVDALNWININSPVPASTNLDGDGDGNVDNVCFIIRAGSSGWNELLWSHARAALPSNVYINGKRVGTGIVQPENQTSVKTLCHEMFHIIGSPDLYHYTSYMGVYIGPVVNWDPMESGSGHMLMYMKWKYSNYKWISTIPEITTTGTYTLNPVTSPVNNCYKIASPYSAFEYFVVEYRNKSGTFETNVPGSGLIVYRIDTRRTGNGNGPPDEVYIYRPSGTTAANGYPDYAFFSSSVGRIGINDGTNPNSFLQDGSPGGLNISNVTTAGTTITFKVTLPSAGGQTLSVAPLSLTIVSTSVVTGNINVISNTNWTATDDADWLDLSSSYGNGNGTLIYTVTSTNTSTSPRSANITFSASGVNSVIVPVIQNGTGYGLNLIAHYPLVSNASDITGNYPDMTIINAPFSNGGIYCNGIFENEGFYDVYTPVINQISYDRVKFYVEFKVEQYSSSEYKRRRHSL
jgi:M6 family metalloprotease-like protein